MKKYIVFITLLSTFWGAFSQEITGDWNGLLQIKNNQVRIVFHISQNEEGYVSTMDSPDEGAYGIPASTTTFSEGKLFIEIKAAGVRYEGKMEDGEMISGAFQPAGLSFPLVLSREMPEKDKIFRPQDPVKPYPYMEENVTFRNESANIELAGTLTIPSGANQTFPVVILISGSGPQDRNEEWMGHRPFLVLADHLTRQGIAVLRYDDRGFGESTGDFHEATSADFATDVEAAISFVKSRPELDEEHIGLVGHSEGGLIAPIVAAGSDDVNFIVLMAGPGLTGAEVLIDQVELIGKTNNWSDTEIQNEQTRARNIFRTISNPVSEDSIHKTLVAYLQNEFQEKSKDGQFNGLKEEDYLKVMIRQYMRPWLRFFIQYDPANTLKKVTCPVLAINGSEDVQVSPRNLPLIANALAEGGNEQVTIKEFSEMNHLFQTCKTCSMSEYDNIEQTITPKVMEEISDWIWETIR